MSRPKSAGGVASVPPSPLRRAQRRDNAARIRDALNTSSTPLDLAPGTAYEALTRAKVDDLEADMREIRARVETLMWSVIGAVIVAVVLQIGGWS